MEGPEDGVGLLQGRGSAHAAKESGGGAADAGGGG